MIFKGHPREDGLWTCDQADSLPISLSKTHCGGRWTFAQALQGVLNGSLFFPRSEFGWYSLESAFFRHTSSFSAIARSKYAAWLIETARNDMKPYETVPRGAQRRVHRFFQHFSHVLTCQLPRCCPRRIPSTAELLRYQHLEGLYYQLIAQDIQWISLTRIFL